MSWLILCFKTLHALLLSALLCFFTIWIFPSHPKTPSLSLSPSLHQACCDVPVRSAPIYTQTEREKQRGSLKLQSPPSAQTVRGHERGHCCLCWFPGQGSVRKSTPPHSSHFPPSDTCTFYSTRCSFQRPSVKVEKQLNDPLKRHPEEFPRIENSWEVQIQLPWGCVWLC